MEKPRNPEEQRGGSGGEGMGGLAVWHFGSVATGSNEASEVVVGVSVCLCSLR